MAKRKKCPKGCQPKGRKGKGKRKGKRCKKGVNKNTGACLKHKRRSGRRWFEQE